jgi:hypothetical protein
LRADAATPTNVASNDGMLLPIPAGTTLPANGVRDSIVATGPGGDTITIHGYLRDDGAGGREWLMTPQANALIVALDAIPGPGGWTDTTARNTYASLGQALIGLGVPSNQVASGFAQLYNAAKADLVAKGWKP